MDRDKQERLAVEALRRHFDACGKTDRKVGINEQFAVEAAIPHLYEQWREELLSDAAVEHAELAEGAVWEAELRNGEVTPEKSSRMTRAGLEGALDSISPSTEEEGRTCDGSGYLHASESGGTVIREGRCPGCSRCQPEREQ